MNVILPLALFCLWRYLSLKLFTFTSDILPSLFIVYLHFYLFDRLFHFYPYKLASSIQKTE